MRTYSDINKHKNDSEDITIAESNYTNLGVISLKSNTLATDNVKDNSIVQYIGESDDTYIKGVDYEFIDNKWVPISDLQFPSDAKPTNVKVGHLESGEDIAGKSVMEILKKILIGDVEPTGGAYIKLVGDDNFTFQTTSTATLEYSFDNKTWESYEGGTITTTNKELYLRGKGNTAINSTFIFGGSATSIALTGDIRALFNYEDVESITEIGSSACVSMFDGCTSLTSVNLNGVTSINGDYVCYYMFSGCTSLTSVNLNGLTSISGASACDSMFSGCTSLISVNLNGLTSISGGRACQYMFKGCTALTSINLNGLTSISGEYACYLMFYDCTALTSIDLSGVTSISGDKACAQMFFERSSLTSINLNALTSISGDYACDSMFSGCTSLTSVNLDGLTTINGDSACRYIFDKCTSLTGANLNSLTSINGEYACTYMFLDCTALTSINLNGLTSISGGGACQYMFYSCSSLTSINLNGLTSINGDSACYLMFYDCTALKIGESGTEGKKFITIPADTESTCIGDMFYGTGGSFTGTPTAGSSYYLED